MRNIYMYLTDTMADWEIGYLLQALTLQKYLPEQKYRLVTFAISRAPVKTAGGMTILPDISLNQLNEDEAAALLLAIPYGLAIALCLALAWFFRRKAGKN